MEQAFKFIIINWESISLILMGVLFVAEKLVKLSPAKWDDIVVDGIRELIQIKKDRDLKKESAAASLSDRTTRPPGKDGR